MKVVVLTTSYPRYEGDPAGNFVADAVEQLRERGVEVDVVSPASFRHFGIAYGSGVMGNLQALAVEGGARAGDARLVRAGGAPRGARRRPRACALAALGRGRAGDRASRSWCSSGGPTSSWRGGCAALARRVLSRARLVDLRLECARRGGARARRARGARDPERGRAARAGGRAGRAAGGAVRRAALAGEGHPRARAGRRRDEADGRGRRPAARRRCPGRSGSCRITSCRRCTSGRPWWRCRRTARASASPAREAMAARPAGGRERGRRAARPGRRRRDRAARPAARRRRAAGGARAAARRCRAARAGWARPAASAMREHFAWPAVTDADDPGLRGRACRLSGPQSCSACSGPGSRSRAASAAAGVPVTGITMHPHEFGARSRYLRDVLARAGRRGGAEGAARRTRRATSSRCCCPSATTTSSSSCATGTRWASCSSCRCPTTPTSRGACGTRRRCRRKPSAPGVDAPRTVAADSIETLRSLDLRPPFLLKPVEGQHFAGSFGEKVLVAQTPDELVAPWKRAKERGFDTVVQELVPDSEDGIWSLFAYIGRSGRPLATATGVKVRQGPLHFGTSAVFRTTPQPRVRELGLRLLESAGYKGFAQVEFAYDRRDGDFKLLEVNTRVPMWAGVAMSRSLRHRPDRLRRPLRQARAGAGRPAAGALVGVLRQGPLGLAADGEAARADAAPAGRARTCSGTRCAACSRRTTRCPRSACPPTRARRSPDADRAARPAELHGALRPRARLGARPPRPRRHAADRAVHPRRRARARGLPARGDLPAGLVAARPPLASLTRPASC